MWKNKLFFVWVMIFFSFPYFAEGKEKSEVTFIVKSSPDSSFESKLHIQNQQLMREILNSKKVEMDKVPELPYAYLILKDTTGKKELMISYSLNLFEMANHTKLQVEQKTKQKLNSYISLLLKHHYGEPVSWKEAAHLFPRKGYAEVVDVETGKHFQVQRRAGSQHADVQPLTAEDTKIMKEIYSGEWSWKRRAILVRTGGRLLAGSMHGMPHGAGAITWNNFPGHFCIHFKDSTTHRKSSPDPGHDLMISKSSGELLDRLVHGSPEEVIGLFIAAIQEQDRSVIKLMLNQSDPAMVQAFLDKAEQIEGIRIEPAINQKTTNGLLYLQEIPINTIIKRKGAREEKICMNYTLTRGGFTERWKMEIEPLLNTWGSP